MKLLDRIINIIIYYWEKTRTDIFLKLASLMILGVFGLIGGQRFFITDGDRSLLYESFPSSFDYVVAIMILIPALFIIYKKFLIDISKSNFLFYISDKTFNTEDILKRGFIPSKGRVNLIPYEKKIDTYKQDEVIKAYNLSKDNINHRTMNNNVENTYIAGLGGFPHLFVCGSLFGSAYASNITVLDYDRDNSKWYTLPLVGESAKYVLLNNKDKSLKETISKLLKGNSEDIGIAICNTFSIDKKSIPNNMKNKTIFIEPNIGRDFDSVDNKTAQDSLIKQLSLIMGEMSNTKKRIHLFVAARASFCIKLGIGYMPQTHGKVVLHNYNKITKKRDWAIELVDGEVNKYVLIKKDK